MAADRIIDLNEPTGPDGETLARDLKAEIEKIWETLPVVLSSVAGTGSAFTAVVSPAPLILVNGMSFYFRPHTDSVVNGTLTLTGLGTYAIRNHDGSRIRAGGLRENSRYLLTYFDSSLYVLAAPSTPGFLSFNAYGDLADRSDFDGEADGFVYLATDQDPWEYSIRQGGAWVSAPDPVAKAEQWADAASGVEVEVGRYSAKHWALAAAAVGDIREAIESRVAASPLDYDATGDGVADDRAEYTAANAALTNVYLPGSRSFNLGASLTDIGTAVASKMVYGAGALIIAGVTLTGFAALAHPILSNLVWAPDIYAEELVGQTSGPYTGANNYFNTIVSSGSVLGNTANDVWRCTAFGHAIGQTPLEWERNNALGNGAMRFAEYAKRCTAIGDLVFQWGGATSQANLIARYHDFWRSDVGHPGVPSPYTAVNVSGIVASTYTTSSGATAASATITSATHGFSVGWTVRLASVGGMTQINGITYEVVEIVSTTVFKVAVDATAFSAYTSGGTVIRFWDFDGLETANPGIGEWISEYDTYPLSTSYFDQNVGVGRNAGLHIIRGESNTFVGYEAGAHMFVGDFVTCIGEGAGRDGVKADRDTYLGARAGDSNQEGVQNVYVGYAAGRGATSGNYSVIIGVTAGDSTSGSTSNVLVWEKCVLIGYEAGKNWGANLVSVASILAIQNDTSRVPLISGDFTGARVGINITPLTDADPGVNTLKASLHVRGSANGLPGIIDTGGNVALFEGSGNAGVTILAGNDNIAAIYIGDDDDSNIGGLLYDHLTDRWSFRADNGTSMRVGGSGYVQILGIPVSASGLDSGQIWSNAGVLTIVA